MKWKCLQHTLDLQRRGEIMGILNVTPDSFSDGGLYEHLEAALAQGCQLIEGGAAIIDIGGESTRPGAEAVSLDEELSRVLPVLEALARQFHQVVLSIDTSKVEVARAAIEKGAHIINDITGFRDPAMVALAASTGAGIVVMHMQGEPRTMQQSPSYTDPVTEIKDFFTERHASLTTAGIDAEQIVYDPGIGFGKTTEHNLELLRHLDRLQIAGRPMLLGASRKAFIGRVLQSNAVADRNWSTVAITSLAREQGVRLHRVHDAAANLQALRMTEAMLPSSRQD